jgi:hypothetical protein
MKTILANDKGFSITSALVASGIMSLAMAAMMLSNEEISALVDQVRKTLDVEWSCTASLVGIDYTAAVEVRDPLNSQLKIVHEGMVARANRWTVSKVRFETLVDVPGSSTQKRGTLLIEFSKNTKMHLGSPILARRIPDVYFEVDANEKLVHCFGTAGTFAAAQSQCEMLGGTWYPDRPHGAQCRLNNAQSNTQDNSQNNGTGSSSSSSSSSSISSSNSGSKK